MAAKDFGAIESDYAFFMAHATEAEHDAAEYARELTRLAAERTAASTAMRLLDFGCGNGDFTHRLLTLLDWPPARLELTLAEPVRHQREAAAERLAKFSDRAVATLEGLPPAGAGGAGRYDVVLSNHALYYVEDLDAALERLCDALAPGGTFLLAIAGWENVLLQFWKIGFAMLGQPVPYYTAEDVAAFLSRPGIAFRATPSHYQLRFPDSPENRLKILRFLFGEYLPQMPLPRLLGEFDDYVQRDYIEVNTHSLHFAATIALSPARRS